MPMTQEYRRTHSEQIKASNNRAYSKLKTNPERYERMLERHKEYKRSPAYREANKRRLKRYRKEFPDKVREGMRRIKERSFRSFLGFALLSVKNCDKSRRNNECDLDIDYLLDLLIKQDYKCSLSGVNLTHITGDLHAVSIDRIDSSKGHIKGNVQLVCQFDNLGKRNKLDDSVRAHYQEVRMNFLRELREHGYLKISQER